MSAGDRARILVGGAYMRSAMWARHLLYLCGVAAPLVAIIACVALTMQPRSPRATAATPPATRAVARRPQAAGQRLQATVGPLSISLAVAPATFGQNRFLV